MSWFRKSAKAPAALTGVSRTLNASHRDQATGQVHGHTWEIKAWFIYNGTDVAVRKYQLDEAVRGYEHTCLPDSVAWGERLAESICRAINADYEKNRPCAAVEVNRPMDGVFARWQA
jgi:6-pyruvoyl-tetrahydropterin synthase